jgi:hypothetical protein
LAFRIPETILKIPVKISISARDRHPAKFREEINNVLKIKLKLPDSLRKIEFRNEEYISLENNYDTLKKFIAQNY